MRFRHVTCIISPFRSHVAVSKLSAGDMGFVEVVASPAAETCKL